MNKRLYPAITLLVVPMWICSYVIHVLGRDHWAAFPMMMTGALATVVGIGFFVSTLE